MMVVVCPSCRAPIVCPNHLRGTLSVCPNCRRDLRVPSEPMSDEDIERLLRRAKDTEPGRPPCGDTLGD